MKGVLFILLELTINHMARLNTIILLSFKGDITAAITAVDYQWLMFYPCVYMFAIWDAFKDAGGGRSPYATLLFVIPAYMATVGIMYSDTLKKYVMYYLVLFGCQCCSAFWGLRLPQLLEKNHCYIRDIQPRK
ncbi:hypothetical protein GCM10020331_035950 [Ectobacillus funiculus]